MLIFFFKKLSLINDIRLNKFPGEIPVQTFQISFQLQRPIPCKNDIAYHLAYALFCANLLIETAGPNRIT
jgi:hypothetical protein